MRVWCYAVGCSSTHNNTYIYIYVQYTRSQVVMKIGRVLKGLCVCVYVCVCASAGVTHSLWLFISTETVRLRRRTLRGARERLLINARSTLENRRNYFTPTAALKNVSAQGLMPARACVCVCVVSIETVAAPATVVFDAKPSYFDFSVPTYRYYHRLIGNNK